MRRLKLECLCNSRLRLQAGKVDFERWQKVPKITHTLRHNSHVVLDGYARERTREREKPDSVKCRTRNLPWLRVF